MGVVRSNQRELVLVFLFVLGVYADMVHVPYWNLKLGPSGPPCAQTGVKSTLSTFNC